jgi:hypothetical protein
MEPIEGQREDVYVRKPYVRKPHISVTPVKTLSEPRKVPGHVRRREVRKYTALPPPGTSTPANTTHKANRGGDDDDGGGPDRGGDKSHNGDDDQGNDGNDSNDDNEEQEQAEINNASGLDESEDDFESACSTPWPEDTFKELSAPEREIVPAAASEISELQTELSLLEESAREEQAGIKRELTDEEKTRNYRIQQNLQSNLFIPYLKGDIDPPIYCLFADNRLVWRYEIKAQDTRLPYSSSIRRWRGRDRALVNKGELERAGWIWQDDSGVWERLPTPFEVSLSRRKQILSIKILDEHR